MAGTKRFFQINQSVLISAAVHLSILAALAFCGFTQQRTQVRSLKMSWGNDKKELQSIEISRIRLESDDPRETEIVVTLPSLEVQFPEPAVERETNDTAAWASEFANPVPLTGVGQSGRSGQGRRGSSGQHERAADQGLSDGGRTVTFFGAGAPAEKIVFVLDSSGSMKEPMYAQSRERVLKAEVMRVIRSLGEERSFDVIFFNEKSLALDSRGLRPATAENRKEMLRWVRAVIPHGDTFPGPALRRALELDPDIIFFLTDGVFAAETVDQITAENEGNIPIFTICLGDPRGASLLIRLASQNGGLYRFVP